MIICSMILQISLDSMRHVIPSHVILDENAFQTKLGCPSIGINWWERWICITIMPSFQFKYKSINVYESQHSWNLPR